MEAAQASHAKLVSDHEARLEAREKLLAAAEKAAAMGRDAFVSLDLTSRKALQDLYGSGYEKLPATPEEGRAELHPKLAAALEGIIIGVGPMVEGEARALFTSAATRIFSHLYLWDPTFDLGALLEPVDPELHDGQGREGSSGGPPAKVPLRRALEHN